MKTKVINLIGGPGIGKSTLSAELYAVMKKKGMDVEMVREVAKKYAINGRKINAFDQLSILGEQIKEESSLFGKVEYIVTDSPVLLGDFYFRTNHDQDFMTTPIKEYYRFAENQNVKFINVLMPRNVEYNQNGRFESEVEAKNLDVQLERYLNRYGYEFLRLPTNKEILEML